MSKKQRVLLVDDDHDILRGVQFRLHAAGYDTLQATCGEQSVDMAIKDHPDAIVLDVKMPRMDGLAVLAKLQQREDTKDIPVIMLSASLLDRETALDLGARYFLTKPYQGKMLLETIQSTLCEHENAIPG